MESSEKKALLISTLILRKVVGILAFALPFGLVFFSGFSFQPSISEYYYTPAGNIFVGAMCAVGVFLCCYQGYEIGDWYWSLAAGLASILVGLLPVALDGATGLVFARGVLHFVFAATFLLCLAYLSLCKFTKTYKDKKKITLQKLHRNQREAVHEAQPSDLTQGSGIIEQVKAAAVTRSLGVAFAYRRGRAG